MPKLSAPLHLWVCTNDPSGDFLDRQFATIDLDYGSRVHNWEPGTTWRNVGNASLMAYISDKLELIMPPIRLDPTN